MGITTTFTCDTTIEECKAKLELDGPYHINKEKMKAEGWKNKKVNDVWKLFCKDHEKKT